MATAAGVSRHQHLGPFRKRYDEGTGTDAVRDMDPLSSGHAGRVADNIDRACAASRKMDDDERVRVRIEIVREFGPRGTSDQCPDMTAKWLDTIKTEGGMRQVQSALRTLHRGGNVSWMTWTDHPAPVALRDHVPNILANARRAQPA